MPFEAPVGHTRHLDLALRVIGSAAPRRRARPTALANSADCAAIALAAPRATRTADGVDTQPRPRRLTVLAATAWACSRVVRRNEQTALGGGGSTLCACIWAMSYACTATGHGGRAEVKSLRLPLVHEDGEGYLVTLGIASNLVAAKVDV